MHRIIYISLFISIIITSLSSSEISDLAKKLSLYGGTKAIIQWERVFSSQRRLKRYKLDELPQSTQDKLKVYLIEHAADSKQPMVPGL